MTLFQNDTIPFFTHTLCLISAVQLNQCCFRFLTNVLKMYYDDLWQNSSECLGLLLTNGSSKIGDFFFLVHCSLFYDLIRTNLIFWISIKYCVGLRVLQIFFRRFFFIEKFTLGFPLSWLKKWISSKRCLYCLVICYFVFYYHLTV